MALRKGKNVEETATTTEETAMDTAATPDVAPDTNGSAPAPVDKDRIRQLFSEYEQAEADYKTAEEEANQILLEASQARSAVIQQIGEATGGQLIKYKGQTVRVVKRGSTFYFRGLSQPQDMIEV